MDRLAILSKTIADHACKLAYEEWENEHGEVWHEILSSAGLDTPESTLDVDGHIIPIESITKAVRVEFLRVRSAQLESKLTQSVVEKAFKKVIDEDSNP
jgi:hypothetical protein